MVTIMIVKSQTLVLVEMDPKPTLVDPPDIQHNWSSLMSIVCRVQTDLPRVEINHWQIKSTLFHGNGKLVYSWSIPSFLPGMHKEGHIGHGDLKADHTDILVDTIQQSMKGTTLLVNYSRIVSQCPIFLGNATIIKYYFVLCHIFIVKETSCL